VRWLLPPARLLSCPSWCNFPPFCPPNTRQSIYDFKLPAFYWVSFPPQRRLLSPVSPVSKVRTAHTDLFLEAQMAPPPPPPPPPPPLGLRSPHHRGVDSLNHPIPKLTRTSVCLFFFPLAEIPPRFCKTGSFSVPVVVLQPPPLSRLKYFAVKFVVLYLFSPLL